MTEKKNRYFGLHPEGNIIAESGRYGTADVYIPETTEEIKKFHKTVDELEKDENTIVITSTKKTLWERFIAFLKWMFMEGESK